jgi:two-component system, cell cycle response regulator DivK
VPDLVLMDLSLPGLEGWEVASRLKADDRTKHVPISAVTAHALEGVNAP